jgi:uncharacterized membrane protein YraQ (UPF0718 family)
MQHFMHMLLHYCVEILPALAIGFFISGLVHEFISQDIVGKYLGRPGIKPIFWATLIGALLPVCCWGSLPIAISFYKKGAKLGPILAFLVATPATSISAFLVTLSVLGLGFAVYSFFAVILMGIVVGIIGNFIQRDTKLPMKEESCPHCRETASDNMPARKKRTFLEMSISVLDYAFIRLPKEIGLELIIGIILAALVATYVPIGKAIHTYLAGWSGYLFSVVFGIIMYLCATASVPLVDSFIRQGLDPGAGMTLLLIGPITSYGTILVLRKEFGLKTLIIFLASLIILTVLSGIGFSLFTFIL